MATFDELMAKLRAEARDCHAWSSGPGDRYAPHAHPYEKILYCVRGSITFAIEDEHRSLELREGERMSLPAGTRHSALVGVAGVTCIEGKG